jgi:hypothetical protein
MGARPAVALLLLALILVPAAGGAGPPEPRVRDGVTASSWRLRPGTLVTPERRIFRILVTESACAGGQPASGRVEEPLVIRERTRVQVAMFVRPLDGPATCLRTRRRRTPSASIARSGNARSPTAARSRRALCAGD